MDEKINQLLSDGDAHTFRNNCEMKEHGTYGKVIMQFKLILRSDFLRKSYARRMFHGWWKLAIAFFMILVSVCIGYRGIANLSTWSVFGLSAVVITLLIFGVAWFRQSKMIDDWIHQQGGEPVVYDLSDEAVASSSVVGSTTLKWDAFSQLTHYRLRHLAFVSAYWSAHDPTGQVPAGAMDFLKSRFLSYGKKVNDKRKSLPK